MLVATLTFARTLTCYTSSLTFIDLFHSLTANFSIGKTVRSSAIQLRRLHVSSIISSTILARKDSIQTKNIPIPQTNHFFNLVDRYENRRKEPWRHSEGKKNTFPRHSGRDIIGDLLQTKKETSYFDYMGAPQGSLDQKLTQNESVRLRTPKFAFWSSPTSLNGGKNGKDHSGAGRLCVFVDAEVIAALTQMFGWLSGDVPLFLARSGQKDADCQEPDDTDDCEATKKSKALELVLLLIKQHAIIVFSKTYCPYCKRAKSVFEDLQVQPFVLELDLRDDGEHIQQALFRITGSKTVPQVFIDNDFIGGSDDLVQLLENGELKKILYWQSAHADATKDSES